MSQQDPPATLPAPSGVITLLTDFGLSDPFVGVMKGVILSRFPNARVVDLCHGIRPQAIAEGAFWLERCHGWFPQGTVHVAVVDPGVGSARRVLAASISGHYFLLPDNGLLAESLTERHGARVLEVDLSKLGIVPASATFHGRDVFAPVAGGLASGARHFEALGVPTRPLPSLLPLPRRTPYGAAGEVLCVDHFGNLITNLDEALARQTGARELRIAGQSIPWLRTYADAAPGALLALINAFGVLEIAARDGSAESRLNVSRGAAVELHGAGTASSGVGG
jgi:S-adenosylmethionine hydrolase